MTTSKTSSLTAPTPFGQQFMDWLSFAADEEEPPEYLKRRRELALHPEARAMIEKLLRLGDPECSEDQLRAFIELALALPYFWSFHSRTRRKFREKDPQELGAAAAAFQSALDKHQDLVEWYLLLSDESGRVDPARGRDRLKQLVASVQAIREQGAAGAHYLMAAALPTLSRKLSQRSAYEKYCIRALGERAQKYFGRSIHREIALLLNVVLQHTPPLDASRVKEVLRDK